MLETAGLLLKALTLGIAFRSADRGQALAGSDRQMGAPVLRADAGPGPAEIVLLDDHRPQKPPPSPPRKPAVAARRFLSWLHDEIEFYGYAETYGREIFWANGPKYPYQDPSRPYDGTGLWQFYLWHCEAENTTPIAENNFAEALGKICKKRLVPDRSTGKRRRLTAYRLPEPKQQRAAA